MGSEVAKKDCYDPKLAPRPRTQPHCQRRYEREPDGRRKENCECAQNFLFDNDLILSTTFSNNSWWRADLKGLCMLADAGIHPEIKKYEKLFKKDLDMNLGAIRGEWKNPRDGNWSKWPSRGIYSSIVSSTPTKNPESALKRDTSIYLGQLVNIHVVKIVNFINLKSRSYQKSHVDNGMKISRISIAFSEWDKNRRLRTCCSRRVGLINACAAVKISTGKMRFFCF